MRQSFSKSRSFQASVLLLGLAFSGPSLAQTGPTIPGDFSRPSYNRGASSPKTTAPRVQPNAPGNQKFTPVNWRNTRSDSSILEAQNRARHTPRPCPPDKPGSPGDPGLTFYNGVPVYPGPNAPLPTPGTYYYQTPYSGWGPYGYPSYHNYYNSSGYPTGVYQR